MAWLIPVTLLVVGTGWLVKSRRRRADHGLSAEPVSGDWLAQARSRGDHQW
jgi:cytochrome c-type biogenesis protein CcmH/NrfF